MARRYARDKNGRFASKGGSGAFQSGRKATASGQGARSDARMVKTLRGGEKTGEQMSARAGRSTAQTRSQASGRDAKFLKLAETKFQRDSNLSRIKQRRLEKERQSFARKGARRGGY